MESMERRAMLVRWFPSRIAVALDRVD